jgi:HlyD family secretion protein
MRKTPLLRVISRALRAYGPAVLCVAAGLAGFSALRKGSLATTTGTLAYAEVIHHSVAPTASGRLLELNVQVGQQVKAKDILAVMDARPLAIQRDGALAELSRRRAALEAATHDAEMATTRTELWLLRARAAEKADRAELAEVETRMTRLDALLERKMIGATEAEMTRERLKALNARVETYDQAVGRGQAGLSKTGGTVEHKKAVDARVEPFRLAVQVQEAAVKALDLAIDGSTLRAPVDGTVSLLSHRVGDAVPAAMEIVSITTTRPGVLMAVLPEADAAKLSVGAAARVQRGSSMFGGMLMADVTEVAPEIEEVPIRARPSPSIPAWGRRVYLQLRGNEPVLPGEAFRVHVR